MERVFADVMAVLEASGDGEEAAALARVGEDLRELRANAGIEDLLQAEGVAKGTEGPRRQVLLERERNIRRAKRTYLGLQVQALGIRSAAKSRDAAGLGR